MDQEKDFQNPKQVFQEVQTNILQKLIDSEEATCFYDDALDFAKKFVQKAPENKEMENFLAPLSTDMREALGIPSDAAFSGDRRPRGPRLAVRRVQVLARGDGRVEGAVLLGDHPRERAPLVGEVAADGRLLLCRCCGEQKHQHRGQPRGLAVM